MTCVFFKNISFHSSLTTFICLQTCDSSGIVACVCGYDDTVSKERKSFSIVRKVFSNDRKTISNNRKVFSHDREVFAYDRKVFSNNRKVFAYDRGVFSSSGDVPSHDRNSRLKNRTGESI